MSTKVWKGIKGTRRELVETGAEDSRLIVVELNCAILG